jgi:LPXTG-motif cell wall-anchored protein
MTVLLYPPPICIYSIRANKGSFSADGLKAGENYEAKVKYTLPNGETIIVGTVKISISEEGEMNISSALIDPYGTITDMDSHEVLQGVEVKLYYADTKRNREAGRLPGTLVDLPLIEGFEPADNGNPQTSDRYGKYAYMVFPYADYYIIANKEGYLTYTSPIISVEDTIVKLDIVMQAVGKDDIRELEIPKTGDGSGHLGIAFLGLAILSVGLNVYLKRKIQEE